MSDIKSQDNDFRVDLYNKYISTFKQFIGNESTANIKSDYKYYRKIFYPILKEFRKSASIIEVGCGSGYILQFLNQEGFQSLYGIDISEEQIEKAKAKGLQTDVKDVFEFFDTNDKKYDIVFALDFVEHFYKQELIKLFTGIRGIMNENGILIIRTPNGQGLFPGRIVYGDLTHLTIFNPDSLTQILRLTGFSKINFYETGPVSKNLIGFVRVVLWNIIKIFVKAIKTIETGEFNEILTQEFICTARLK
jgi:2-polyprenyl-3-methyl-5-hydroxy-6-metoxy-1,4-benzoquinol methylase